MAKHFISILGTGLYSKTVYCCDEGRYETEYVQEAILKLKFAEWTQQDRITIFLTEESKERNWVERCYTEREKEIAASQKKVLPETKKGLESILKKSFPQSLNVEENNIIPLGANEAELWTIFQRIFECLREGDDLYIDITHALRNLPIQMLAVATYARTVKHVQVKSIYYGAYEVGSKGENGVVEAPIFDLITFLNVLDWSQAAHSFVRYGNSEQIEELFQSQRGQSNVKMRELHKVVYEIGNVTKGLETSRGYYDFEHSANNKGGKSILESYHQYRESYQIMMKKDAKELDEDRKQLGSIKPMKGLMEIVDDKLSIFDVNNNLELGLAAIRWSIENNKTQQGFTALEETLKTYLCNYYGLDETTEENRDNICKTVCSLLANVLRDGKELTIQEREEAYREWNANLKERNKTDVEKVYKIFLSIPKDMVILVREISNNRNTMNHFGYSNKGQFSSKRLEENLKEYYQRFVECMERM